MITSEVRAYWTIGAMSFGVERAQYGDGIFPETFGVLQEIAELYKGISKGQICCHQKEIAFSKILTIAACEDAS